MQNLHLLEILAETFHCHVNHYQCLELAVPPRPPSTDNGAHGTKKLMLKTQVHADIA